MSIDKQRKKELAKQYTQTLRRMGVYQIRNLNNGKIYVQSAMDLDGARNRMAFTQQLNQAMFHELQEDWKRDGGAAFVFEELDELKPDKAFTGDREELAQYQKEVDSLLELWLEKLEPYGDIGYNRRS